MFDYYLTVLKKYAVFEGRARRSEYWYFALFNVIIVIILSILDVAIGTYDAASETGYISTAYQLAVLVPSIAVAARRMHDVGKSGWFMLIPIYNFYLSVIEGEQGTNKYGKDPKNPELDGDLDHLVE